VEQWWGITRCGPDAHRMAFLALPSRHGKACSREEPVSGHGHVTSAGVCGKTPETAALQDLLIHYTMG
jgi:hypothetical protein